MEEIVSKNKCSGCFSCYNACPKNCINMIPDEEGFLYPQINQDECIDCGKCKKSCPVSNEYCGNEIGKAYACISKNEEIRMKSSSGGVFSLLAEYVINDGGVVFGAAFDDMMNVHHIMINNIADIELLRGAKYVQSRIGDTYKAVKDHLKDGVNVLFTGTPCQISGLKAYLGCEYDNLILQDIICHGVPSSAVWQLYLEDKKKSFGSDIDKTKKIRFRDKCSGWIGYSLNISFENNKEYTKVAVEDRYIKAFLNNISLRKSCYDCHSKSLNRESDITLGDFWGIDKVCPEMFDNKGTSLVFVNSVKGKQLFDAISGAVIVKEVDINQAVLYNSAAVKSVKLAENREKFMSDVKSMDFNDAVKRNIPKEKLMTKIKRIIKKILKKFK